MAPKLLDTELWASRTTPLPPSSFGTWLGVVGVLCREGGANISMKPRERPGSESTRRFSRSRRGDRGAAGVSLCGHRSRLQGCSSALIHFLGPSLSSQRARVTGAWYPEKACVSPLWRVAHLGSGRWLSLPSVDRTVLSKAVSEAEAGRSPTCHRLSWNRFCLLFRGPGWSAPSGIRVGRAGLGCGQGVADRGLPAVAGGKATCRSQTVQRGGGRVGGDGHWDWRLLTHRFPPGKYCFDTQLRIKAA